MRGKQLVTRCNDKVPRITPADAGKTDYAQPAFTAEEDHPRGCGENVMCCWTARKSEGSPPRMRGKLKGISLQVKGKRITPADAGKTQFASFECAIIEDHPRGCGENFNCFQCFEFHIGSPPRMRGKPVSGKR